MFEVAYLTGGRTKSEIVTRQWKHVDPKDGGWLRLEPGEGKNKKGRMFPLFPQLRAVLDRQRAYTNAVTVKSGRIIPWVFHRDGKPIKDYKNAWRTGV